MRRSEMILLFAVLLPCLMLINSHTSISTINYFPSSTDIGFADSELKIISVLIASAIILGYLSTRSWMPIVAGTLLLISVSCFANPLLHSLIEIDQLQYNNVKIVISDRPDLISALPNYVNANCEMTSENYKSFIALSKASNASQIIKNLSLHKPVDQVKIMCANKIFKT